jgi:4-oxalocrotonate tautomerase
MPEVHVYLAAGRTPEQKKTLMTELKLAVQKTLGTDPAQITVQLMESPKADKMKGLKTFAER